MKTKTINLYEYSELSPDAKERALRNWRENFDSFALQVFMDDRLRDLLEKAHITPYADLKGYPSKYGKVYYSLSCCQGDGVMFEGRFKWRGYDVTIRHSGRYYHSHSKTIDMETAKGAPASDGTLERFEAVYQGICKTLEREGYAEIEELESEAAFIEACDANGYTFREDGTMENE